jgi:hypothetical protein
MKISFYRFWNGRPRSFSLIEDVVVVVVRGTWLFFSCFDFLIH